MSAFEKNMLALREFHFGLYQRLANQTFPNRLEAVEAKNHQMTVRTTVKEYGREKKIFLHSSFDPQAEARRYAEQQMKEQGEVTILYGFGLGYHVLEMALLLESTNRLLVFDINLDVFYLALRLLDLTAVLLNQRIEVHISDDLGQLGREFAAEIAKAPDSRLIIHVPSLTTIPEQFEDFKYLLQEVNLRKSISLEYLDAMKANYLVNREIVTHNIGLFFDKFKGIPIIIVCAGPSLDKNKHLLKGLENKALIICVGHSLKALIKIGVRPHFIITIDPDPLVYKQIEGCEDLDIPFILMATAAANNAQNYRGPKFLACQELHYLPEHESHYLISNGGSVSTAALDIAIKMGGRPIIFIGQDLAYTMYRHHCVDSFHDDVTINPLDTLRRVKGWFGEDVPTTLGMISFNKWIQSRVRMEKSNVFINATEGGALIEGFLHSSLVQVIEEYLTRVYPIGEIITTVLEGHRV